MAFNFPLPTTSPLTFSTSLRCDSHPTLLLSATTQRTLLRSTLKTHKRLSPAQQPTNLPTILSAITRYLPYLLALEQGLAGHLVASETIFVALTSEPETSWRSPILSSPLAPRQAPRVKGKGLDYEILFVLATAAYAHCLDARRHLAPFVSSTASTRFSPDQRKASHNAAATALLNAYAVFSHAAKVAEAVPAGSLPPAALDVQPHTLAALAELAWAHATLLAVVKDDDFLVLAAQTRDSSDREWMYKPPAIPKVRAGIFARLCLVAAEHAGKAVALLSGVANVREDLLKFARDLERVARARSCRFFGVDAEIGGKLGDALGWINAGKRSLGLSVDKDALSAENAQTQSGSRFKPSLTAMKSSWNERKDRKSLERSSAKAPTLDDPGRVEEGRILEALGQNWTRTNDLIVHQLVTDENTLLQTMPSGREIHRESDWVWKVPTLDAGELERLRAPADRDEGDIVGDSDGSDEELGAAVDSGAMPGSWNAGAGASIGRSGTAVSDAYY